MGFLYVKVIESKKVAVRNSFFVNYPFIRIVIGKEKKDTNFKPGIEWWDKILNFRVSKGDHQQIIVQARDKSIHVFGSDWLGEVKLDLDAEDLLDGRVHQMWFKFGRGRKSHSRSPRGYIHLAFHYSEDPVISKRPFSVAPVEEILSFEEWLAVNNKNMSIDSSQWHSASTGSVLDKNRPSPDPNLRKSAPDHSKGLTSDSSMDDINPDPASVLSRSAIRPSERKKKEKTRTRAQTLPDIRSPLDRPEQERHAHFEESDSDSDDEPRVATLIDLSFDGPSDKVHGRSKAQPAVSATSVPSIRAAQVDVDVQIERIKQLSLSQSTTNASASVEPPKINQEPSFAEWYHTADAAGPAFNPKNPFLAMHENLAPTYSVKN